MKANVYRELNHDAKAWPYYVGNRAKQRASIKSQLKTLRAMLATTDCYVCRGLGDNYSVYYEDGNRTQHSGFSDRRAFFYRDLGFPFIDHHTAERGALCKAVIAGPMIAVGNDRVDATRNSLSSRPLREVAELYRQAGSTICNIRD